jgi:hypothetical protein
MLQGKIMKSKIPAKKPLAADRTRWDDQWDKQFSYLSRFKAKNGRWPKASEEFPKGNRIGLWANRQRDLRERGELDAARVAIMQKAGFQWHKIDARGMHWDEQFGYLNAFRKSNKDEWPIAREEFPKGNRLGLWVWRQRQAFAAGTLPKKRRAQLEKIHFPFELPDSWETHLASLRAYRAKHPGRWPKAREEFPKGNRLGLWCHLQRCAHKAGKLDAERVASLDKVGFQWSVKEVSWNRFFELLKEYKRANPAKWPVLQATALKDRRLIAWCSIQRGKQRAGRLTADQIGRLDKLGFRW